MDNMRSSKDYARIKKKQKDKLLLRTNVNKASELVQATIVTPLGTKRRSTERV